ncbi:MAG: membrane protein insertion efficiency factor YidD [Desulfamplus sp.]|nr:membrane protein insertion efficiency factor YidD [Desulfamplus sp.]
MKSSLKFQFSNKLNIFIYIFTVVHILFCLDIALDISPLFAQSNTTNQKSKNLLFKFYSDYISPADGERCGMYPSCSGYAEEAVKKHGLFMGWIMSCDRLIRCGRDEVNISKRVKQPDGKLLTLDPLESNDFWWYPYAPSNE